jgi:hypothetical protein
VVKLLCRYSNRQDLVEPLVDVVRRIEANDQENEPGLDEPHVQADGRYKVAGQLQPDGIANMSSCTGLVPRMPIWSRGSR